MEPAYQKQSPLTIPLAIVIAGGLIAGAVFLSRGGAGAAETGNGSDSNARLAALQGLTKTAAAIPLRAVDASDHIRGNPDAKLLIIEYSDTECPFCKNFHATMQKVIDDYGKRGDVAWVYRHFPLVQLHPKAPKEAEALECAAEQGGSGTFWAYTDELFRVTSSNNGLDPAELPRIAERVGLDADAFNSCLASGRYAETVQKQYAEAVDAGGSGTPFSILAVHKPFNESVATALRAINEELLRRLPPGSPDPLVISSDKLKVTLSGAFPLPTLKQIIELLLK